MSISRRQFIGASGVAVAGVLAGLEGEVRANPLGLRIGSQTWPCHSPETRAWIPAQGVVGLLAGPAEHAQRVQ